MSVAGVLTYHGGAGGGWVSVGGHGNDVEPEEETGGGGGVIFEVGQHFFKLKLGFLFIFR